MNHFNVIPFTFSVLHYGMPCITWKTIEITNAILFMRTCAGSYGYLEDVVKIT